MIWRGWAIEMTATTIRSMESLIRQLNIGVPLTGELGIGLLPHGREFGRTVELVFSVLDELISGYVPLRNELLAEDETYTESRILASLKVSIRKDRPTL